MKKVLYLFVTTVLIISGCNDEDILEDVPNCIMNKIEEIKEQTVGNPPAKIYQDQYKGLTVYYIAPRCCDIMSNLYDENCYKICSPDGGIAGNGDGLCPDFFTSRTDERLIWEDNRN